MKKQITDSPEAAILRQKAEKLLKIKQAKTGIPSSEADTLKLIHELQVYQIELELINEELLLANIRIENLAIEKYKELYDFAPTGYLSLSKTGEITEINFAAANMLGKDRLHLMNNSFALFLSENTRPVFIAFLNNVFTSKVKHSCEVIIAKEGSLPLHVYIDGIISHNNEFCILTLVDFTKTKLAEQNLIKEKEISALSETKYREIINRVTDAIFSYNPDTFEIIEANEATSIIYGYDQDELKGMSCMKFSAEAEKSKTVANEIMEKGASFVNVRHHKKKDGSDIFVQIQGYKIFINERPVIFIGGF